MKEVPDKDHHLLKYLTDVAQESFKILLSTKDYHLLHNLNAKVLSWNTQADSLLA